MKHKVVEHDGVRVLCVSEVRGALSHLQQLIKQHNASAVVHVGSFGFFDGESALSMPASQLTKVANASRVVKGDEFHRMDEQLLRETVGSQLSELPLFLAGVKRFSVPVYVVYGGLEDTRVVSKFRDSSYAIPNLELVDERHSPLIPGTKLRLVGLPGAYDESKLLDSGSQATEGSEMGIAGNGVCAWATLWQIGELCHTVRRTFDPTEIRLFCTQSTAAQSPLLEYLALVLRCDFYLNGTARAAYPLSYSAASSGMDFAAYERRLASAKEGLLKQWGRVELVVRTNASQNVRELVESTVNLLTSPQAPLLKRHIKQSFHSLWHFSLCSPDAGALVLGVNGAKIELNAVSNGLDFSARYDPEEGEELEQKRKNKEKREKEKEKLRRKREEGALQIPTGPAEEKKVHGLWFRNGDRPTEEIMACLAEEDRELAPQIVIKPTTRAGGAKTKVALVLFDTAEQASLAYERVNKDEAGTVSIYQPEQRPRVKRKPRK